MPPPYARHAGRHYTDPSDDASLAKSDRLGVLVVTAEWIAVVVAIVAVGVAGTVAVVSGFRRLADADQRIVDQIAAVDRRVARLEGTIDTLQSVLLSGRRPAPGSDEGAAA